MMHNHCSAVQEELQLWFGPNTVEMEEEQVDRPGGAQDPWAEGRGRC